MGKENRPGLVALTCIFPVEHPGLPMTATLRLRGPRDPARRSDAHAVAIGRRRGVRQRDVPQRRNELTAPRLASGGGFGNCARE